ncbi:integral membrane protein [Akanthomyces lecanii RCEF 1005]|uniref:Integral membrane protein n=1 Tax=Akanthomyces lecanii RCEF 1005 TaxID=1081108 RepID=A0A168DUI3_CORDF|nr:integral membrane protein [Akanthomyces lecanii RCEF 1005]
MYFHVDTLATICDDYDKPSRKAELIVLAAAGMTLATVMGALRCWSRLVTVRRLGWDDWTALAALILLLVMGSVGMVATKWGFGVHYWDSDIRLSRTIHQVFWAMEVGYLFNINLIKASIMLLYGRTFETTGWQTFVRYSLLFIAARTVAFMFPLIFQCKPLRAIWDPEVDGVCLNVSAIGFAGAACSIIQDFVLMIAPIPTLWRLQLPKTQRILLAVLFGFGSM